MDTSAELRKYYRYAEFKKGTSNKFYQVQAIETGGDGLRTRVVYTYGRIGTDGQRKVQEGLSWSYAKQLADDKFEQKLAKGYKEVSALEALASACEEPEDRPQRGLSPVEVELPSFQTGNPATDKRLETMCEKYLKKLNLIRASYYELSVKQHKTQNETLFKQFRNEFRRICGSKTHGEFANNPLTEQKVRVFFRSLIDVSGDFFYGEGW